MIKLALIDNGIPYHMRNNRNQRIVHKSFLASKCDPSEYKDDKSFHGAVCVGIITSICSDIELWDLLLLRYKCTSMLGGSMQKSLLYPAELD